MFHFPHPSLLLFFSMLQPKIITLPIYQMLQSITENDSFAAAYHSPLVLQLLLGVKSSLDLVFLHIS